MGKFTDGFFAFPIKIYDGFSLRKALEEEEKEDVDAPVAADWVSGICRLPAKEVKKLSWYDGFSRERTVEQAATEGFDQTTVISGYGEFVSTWNRKKFEEKLNEFMEKFRESDNQRKLAEREESEMLHIKYGSLYRKEMKKDLEESK